MRFLSFPIVFVMCCDAMGATLVDFGPEFCAPAQLHSNGECQTPTQGKCPAGYVFQAGLADDTYRATGIGVRCTAEHDMVEMPEIFYPIYSAQLVKYGPTLCGPGMDFLNGKCESRVRGRCSDNYYTAGIDRATFTGGTAQGNQCMKECGIYDMPDWLDMISNGMLVDFGPELCGGGKYLSDGVCTSRMCGDCPAEFYDVTDGADTLTKSENGACADEYLTYGLTQNCTADTPGPLCAVLCDDGMLYTGMGTCAAPCAFGARTLLFGSVVE